MSHPPQPPTGPPSGQPSAGYPQPPAQPPKKKSGAGKIIGLGCGIPAGLVLVIIVIIAAVAGTGGGPSDQSGQAGNPSSTPAGVGDTVNDGDFAFTVTGTDTSQTLGEGPLSEEAQGKYVLVEVTVKNTGDKAKTLTASNVKLLSGGKEYSGDTAAWALVENNPLLEQLNPGNSIDGTFVFDIPENVEPEEIKLQGGLVSDGVTVQLS